MRASGFAAGHALVIGIGSYQYIPRWNVPITARDAEEVATVLRDPQLCAYIPDQVRLLTGTDATRQSLLGELDTLARTLGEEHTFVVFYCGHGQYSDDGAYHLSTHDTQLTDSRKIKVGTAISHQELIQQLQRIKARRVLLIFNACHSGEISPALGEEEEQTGLAVPASTASALLGTGSGRVIITACREDQVSYIGDSTLTRFTGALVDGLRGRGDVSSRNGFISAYDLYLQTYYAVHDISERYNQQQDPELTVLKGVGPFAVALYKGATTLGPFDDQEPPPSSGAVREVRPERSRAALNIIMSQVAGRDAIAGNQVNAGRDAAGRDLIRIGGDSVAGDKIDARGSRGFINKASGSVTQVYGDQSTINTGGGDYAGGNIDKRQGTFVSGDQTSISDVSGSVLNIKSTLSNVTQTIGAAGADSGIQTQLQQLTEQLAELLRQTAPTLAREGELVSKRVEALVEAATDPARDKDLIDFHAGRLEKATSGLQSAVPAVIPVSKQIIALVRKFAGVT